MTMSLIQLESLPKTYARRITELEGTIFECIWGTFQDSQKRVEYLGRRKHFRCAVTTYGQALHAAILQLKLRAFSSIPIAGKVSNPRIDQI